MPGPYSESPNIPGTYRVSQNTVNQILGMGMERALQMARTNPDPEFREAVYRIYPSAAGGAGSTGGVGFNRPAFTNPATVGAGPAESSAPGSLGGLGTGSPVAPSASSAPIGLPNNAPPVPPPPPIPPTTIPTPPVPDQLRQLFGLSPAPNPVAAAGSSPPTAVPPAVSGGLPGATASAGIPTGSPGAGVPGGIPGGVTNGPVLGGSARGSAAAGGGAPGSNAPYQDFVSGLGANRPNTPAALAPPPGLNLTGGQVPPTNIPPGGRQVTGPFEGIGQTNPMARQLLEKRILTNPVSNAVDFAGTGIGGFYDFGPTNPVNEDLANMILEILGISTPRTSPGRQLQQGPLR